MICSTSTASALLRKVAGRNKTVVCSFNKMIEQFAVDPTVMSPPRELYVVTNDDITTTKLKAAFEEAAASKHVNTKIIFVNKGKKEFYQNGCPGVDAVYQGTKIDELLKVIGDVLKQGVVEAQQVEIGAAPIDKIHVQQQPTYKLPRERAKKPDVKRHGKVSTVSVTGMPVVMVEGRSLFISRATDEKTGVPIEPPKYFAVSSDGQFMPTYYNGDPIETDEYGNILDPYICLDESGAPMCDEDGYVTMDEEAIAKAEAEEKEHEPSKAEDVLVSNTSGIKTYAEVEKDSSMVADTGVDIGADIPVAPSMGTSSNQPSQMQDIKSNILSRVEDVEKVSDLSLLMREMNASAVIKDLVATNSTYYGIEEKLKSLQDAIYVIMNDKSYSTMNERYSKIIALLHDQNFCNAAGNTMIEQLTTEIVTMVVRKAQDYSNNRITEIENAIKRTSAEEFTQNQPAKLAALTDERTSIITELMNLECDVKELLFNTDGFIKDVDNNIAKRISDFSPDEDFNTWIKARGSVVTDAASLTAIGNLMQLSVEVPEQLDAVNTRIKSAQLLLRKLLQIESETYDAMNTWMEKLRNRGIEGRIIVQSDLKKSLNVFVGTDNVGKTIVPYLFAKYKSKQNCHVLLVNIAKNAKFSQYGITPIDYDTFATSPVLDDFVVVKGNIPDEVAAGQQFIATLTRAADYYKYIYIVMDDDQVQLFNLIAPDVFSVNYLVDTNPVHLDRTKAFIDSVNLENVGERIFINRCNINLKPILDRLGKTDSYDYQICMVPDIPEITDGSLSGFDPYGISSVTINFEELHRHVKS